jgi:hypothetical protein
MEQLKKHLDQLKPEIDKAAERIGLNKLKEELAEKQAKMAKPDFWQDNLAAQETSAKKKPTLPEKLDPGKICKIPFCKRIE